MATVTVFTAERMQAIEDEAIVSGAVVGNDLILTKNDATTINAGNVRGPTGSTGASGPNTQVIPMSFIGTVATVVGALRWYPPSTFTISKIIVSCGTAPTGASLIVDINKNGTTIFTTQGNRPTITAGTNTDLSSIPDITSIASTDYITVDIDQVGSSVAGANLVVEIIGTL